MYGYEEDDIPIIFTGIRPGEKISEELFTESENIKKTKFEKLFTLDDENLVLTSKEIQKMLGEFSQSVESNDKNELKYLLRKYSY
jgi:FlaA1/EpsC-like NDP-sugar epimerase